MADDLLTALLVSDALSVLAFGASTQWGLYQDGVPVIIADSVKSFEYKEDWDLSTAPQEEGAFQSYNKVQTPFTVRIRFMMGGSAADRQALLQSIDAIIGTTELYDAVTPEAVYESVNPIHRDYSRRNDSGLGLLCVDLICEQVRVTGDAQFTSSNTSAAIKSPQSPQASPAVSGGVVQPSPAPAAFSGRFSTWQ